MLKQVKKVQKNKLALNKTAVAALSINQAQAKWIAGGHSLDLTHILGFNTAGTSRGEEEPECTSKPTTVETVFTGTDSVAF